ncbi:hypothetical protein TYRP_008241 [Tyrophagus putrescentiae]|nr:hypothetical protein TYRP_008241 [Tyrophagus putrescentiae]
MSIHYVDICEDPGTEPKAVPCSNSRLPLFFGSTCRSDGSTVDGPTLATSLPFKSSLGIVRRFSAGEYTVGPSFLALVAFAASGSLSFRMFEVQR